MGFQARRTRWFPRRMNSQNIRANSFQSAFAITLAIAGVGTTID
jgi:hypothetical protein